MLMLAEQDTSPQVITFSKLAFGANVGVGAAESFVSLFTRQVSRYIYRQLGRLFSWCRQQVLVFSGT